MANKKLLNIDPKTLVINGSFQQILPGRIRTHSDLVELTKAWLVIIPARKSMVFITFLKNHTTTTGMDHLKKLRKSQTNKSQLQGLVAMADEVTKHQVFEMLCADDEVHQELEIHSMDDIVEVSVPKYPPVTQEEAKDNSKQYWPVIWKGDPNIQQLNQEVFDMLEISQNLRDIIEIAKIQKNNGELPIVTRLYDPENKQILATAHDERFKHILHHSVINCVGRVAANEVQRRGEEDDDEEANNDDVDDESSKKYLCVGYDVYTTHEPCSYCCMALVHSRIRRLFYLKPSPKTGAIAPDSAKGYCIHQSRQLNWAFHSFKWCDPELLQTVPVIDDNLFV